MEINELNTEIEKYRILMNKARFNGHGKAYTDLKKHYDKLIKEKRKSEKHIV